MSDLAVGQTVRLSDGRNGVIRFVGQTLFAAGEWVGVELEDASGKNDGGVQGERYFECPMGHGMFVRPTTVTILAAVSASTAKPAGGARKSARPSSMFTMSNTTMSGRGIGPTDPGLSKRMSLNAPSPSPAPRVSRPSSTVARSPTKSPTKQLSTAVSSASTSRTGTPANGRPSIGTKSRPSAGVSRTSMGPPSLPGARPPRQPSVTSTAGRSITAPASGSRIASGRLAMAGKTATARNMSVGSQFASENGSAAVESGDRTARASRKSSDDDDDDEILSPQPTGLVQAKMRSLERLMSTSPQNPKPAVTGASAGSAAATTALVSSRSAGAAGGKETDELKAKLRVLEKKRMEDREKLRDLEKLQGERDKFERIIQTLQIKYQPQQQENMELKRQLKEAEARLESIEAMQVEHESAMELATLDREMAEETAEVVKAELDALKQKAEELELEVDILREENAEFTKGMTAEERASTGWLQMERNNERLREALIRLRDLTQQQEEELRHQIRALEDDVRELEAVREAHAVASASLTQAEAAIEDLRQQLDTALGAEDMIEELMERNMSQQEQIEELRATVEDLQSLRELADELEVNHVENEKEMQDELDFKDGLLAEQARRAALQDEALEDMEYTLSRFRELVTSLQGDLEDMRASHAVNESESEQLASRSRAMLSLNMKLQMSATKAQAKAIDLELRRLEAREAEQHLEMVSLFLPDAYQTVRDSVLALLRFRRLAFKANMLAGSIKERIANGGGGGGVGGTLGPGHEDNIFWGYETVEKLTWVVAMCDRFERAMSHCSPEQFARYEGALYELEPVERALNGWIDSLRRDELLEKQCAVELQRTVAVMSHLGEIHLSAVAPGTISEPDLESAAGKMHMQALLAQSYLESAAVTLATMRTMVQRVVSSSKNSGGKGYNSNGDGGDGTGNGGSSGNDGAISSNNNSNNSNNLNGGSNGEENELAQYFAKKIEGLVTQTRGTKVIAGKVLRALEDLRARSLALIPNTVATFEQCAAATGELAKIARQTGLDLYELLREEGRTEPFTYAEVQACVRRTALDSFSSSEADLFSTYINKLRLATAQMAELAALSADLAQTQEFECGTAPWILRSQELRLLRTVPADAEEELRRLKEEHHEARRRMAQRDEELSEAELKIATLEARMREAKAKAGLIIELESKIERAKQEVAVLSDDMAKRDRELKALEADRDKWKRIAGDSRMLAGVALDGEDGDDGSGGGGGGSSGGRRSGDAGLRAGQERAVAAAREMDALRDEIADLQAALRYLREDNRRARLAEQQRQGWLVQPLKKPRSVAEQRQALVAAEAQDVLGELVRMTADARLYRLQAPAPRDRLAWRPAKTTPKYHAARQLEDLAVWQSWQDAVLQKVQVLTAIPPPPTLSATNAAQTRRKKLTMRSASARLQIRSPGADGKPFSGLGCDVRIVGS